MMKPKYRYDGKYELYTIASISKHTNRQFQSLDTSQLSLAMLKLGIHHHLFWILWTIPD